MAQALLLRPRLLRRLQAALQSGHVLMVAPAGYGKTTLLRSLITHRPRTYYLPLTLADADLAYFRARFEQTVPSHPDALLLLDDVQHLQESPEAVRWLVEQLQHTAPRLVLSGRRSPFPPQLAQEVSDLLAHLTVEELAFTLDESQAVLTERHHNLKLEDLTAWHERTEGWPIAMALLAHHTDPVVPPEVVQAELFPYLAEIFLDGLPSDLRRYLYVTAVPLRFNDALAGALLGVKDDVTRIREEVQRRNLFLEPADLPGWFRYHELVREFLLQVVTFDPTPLFERAVAWFDAQGDREMAIEHALAGRLFREAARRILEMPEEFVWNRSRHLTYRRWVLGLDEQTRATYLELLIRLGTYLHYVADRQEEAWNHLTHGLALAEAHGNPILLRRAHARMASLLFREARYPEALSYCNRLLSHPHCQGQERLFALRIASITLARLSRYPEAETLFHEAIALAQKLGNRREAAFNHSNFAITTLIPLGRFAAAQHHLEQAGPHPDEPGVGITTLLNWCELYASQGDWEGLLAALQKVERALEEVEVQETSQLLWRWYYRALWAVGYGQFEQAEAAYVEAAKIAQDNTFAQGYLAWLMVHMQRQRGHVPSAIRLANQVLSESSTIPFQRALLALEREIAVTTTAPSDESVSTLHPEIRHLIRWRAQAELVRLRALLALRCWRIGDPRWRRHLHAALYALRRPGYAHLLTHRDPDLGAQFWTMALAEGVAVPQTTAALRAIGRPEAVWPLLQHRESPVRSRAAAVLAAMGAEASMPPLAEALVVEEDRETAHALEMSLAHLESLPPPSLRVQLMGTFALWRGGEPIPDQAWPRPITRRVFQYFALHRGIPLSRDQLLDDLWSETDPAKAWATFRTVYSQLRRVLDPYMRPRAPARYFAVDREIYCFDPDHRVQVDVEIFQNTVRRTLDTAHRFDIPPLPTELSTALEGWQPLLPDLPYAEWLLEARERLSSLYAEGCLYVAQALLVRDRPAEAETWARRTVATAPWSEEGYQALMRVYARQGKRSLVLRTYAQAVDTLQRELGAAPSPLTQWLAERVRQGEEI